MTDPLQKLEALIEQVTPGPWYAVNEHDEPIVLTRTPWREPLVYANGVVGAVYDYIAQTTYDMQSTTERPTAEADANLIALSPLLARGLLDLAKAARLIDECEHDDGGRPYCVSCHEWCRRDADDSPCSGHALADALSRVLASLDEEM